MNGHRRFFITFGLVQLAFACGYVGYEPARGVALEQRAAYGAAQEILEELDARDALREPADFDEQIERESMVIQSVRERLERSRGSRRFLAGIIGVFGVLSIVGGCIPDRLSVRARPPDEPVACAKEHRRGG